MSKKDIIFGFKQVAPAWALFSGYLLIHSLWVNGTISGDVIQRVCILSIVLIFMALGLGFLSYRGNKE